MSKLLALWLLFKAEHYFLVTPKGIKGVYPRKGNNNTILIEKLCQMFEEGETVKQGGSRE